MTLKNRRFSLLKRNRFYFFILIKNKDSSRIVLEKAVAKDKNTYRFPKIGDLSLVEMLKNGPLVFRAFLPKISSSSSIGVAKIMPGWFVVQAMTLIDYVSSPYQLSRVPWASPEFDISTNNIRSMKYSYEVLNHWLDNSKVMMYQTIRMFVSSVHYTEYSRKLISQSTKIISYSISYE